MPARLYCPDCGERIVDNECNCGPGARFGIGARVQHKITSGTVGTVGHVYGRDYANMTDLDVRVYWDDDGHTDERVLDLRLAR